MAISSDPMQFCSHNPWNPLRLSGSEGVPNKTDLMPDGKNPGGEF